jgi:hypothetical protein
METRSHRGRVWLQITTVLDFHGTRGRATMGPTGQEESNLGHKGSIRRKDKSRPCLITQVSAFLQVTLWTFE